MSGNELTIFDDAILQPTVPLFINGQFVESKTTEWIDLYDPVRGRRQVRGQEESSSEGIEFGAQI